MEDPQCLAEGPDFVVSWPTITVKVSKVHEHSEGYTGHLRITIHGMVGYPDGPVFGGRVQFDGPRSKGDAVKDCVKRIPEVVWADVFDRACELVKERIEGGEPMSDLAEGDVVEDGLPYLIDPFLKDGDHTCLYGMGGVFKSGLSMAAGVCLSTGNAHLGMNVHSALKTLYLDFEDVKDNQQFRLEQLRLGFAIASGRPHIQYKRAEASLIAIGDSLARQIVQEGIEFMIIDSAAMACGADPEKADSANAYFRVLRSLGLRGTLTIAHQTKTEDKFPFGSIFWWNGFRSVWHLKQQVDEKTGKLHLGMFHRKANNGKLQKPIGFGVEFKDDYIDVHPENLEETPEFLTDLSVPRRIRAAIKGKGLGREELWVTIHDADGMVKRDTFNKALKRMLEDDDVKEMQGKVWLVTKREETA